MCQPRLISEATPLAVNRAQIDLRVLLIGSLVELLHPIEPNQRLRRRRLRDSGSGPVSVDVTLGSPYPSRHDGLSLPAGRRLFLALGDST